MKVAFRASFAKDLAEITDSKFHLRIKTIIEQVDTSTTLTSVSQIKKLQGHSGYYRIRVGDYRLGLMVEGGTAIFVRCLHRKEIYRFFP